MECVSRDLSDFVFLFLFFLGSGFCPGLGGVAYGVIFVSSICVCRQCFQDFPRVGAGRGIISL